MIHTETKSNIDSNSFEDKAVISQLSKSEMLKIDIMMFYTKMLHFALFISYRAITIFQIFHPIFVLSDEVSMTELHFSC